MSLRQSFLGSCAVVYTMSLMDGFLYAVHIKDHRPALESHIRGDNKFFGLWQKLTQTNTMFANPFNLEGRI